LTGIANWTQAGPFLKSPEDSVMLNEGNLNKFVYRLRIRTDDSTKPPDIRGVVPNGFARSPMRKIFTLEATVKDTSVNGKVQKARELLMWMEEASQSAYPIHIQSAYPDLDDHDCIMAPPNMYPIKANPQNDTITFTLMVM